MLPFRAKNPPEHFPYATIGLMALNVLIFAFTSQMFVIVKPDIVRDYAVSHLTMSLLTLTTSMFLHADLLHLAGNMLFLWIFGASVEGRLRPWIFVPLYLSAGYAGALLHDVISGAGHPARPSLGASGAIMGVAGMYLFMFPYSLICALHRTYWIAGWFSVSDIQARWVILYFIGFDLLYQLAFQGADGVGHLAHLGGFAAGFLAVLALRAKRDSEEVSNVQATRAEVKDYSMLSLSDLATLMEHPTEDMNLVIAFCERALTDRTGSRHEAGIAAAKQYIRPLVESIDAQRLAWVLLTIHPTYGGVAPAFYLRMASVLESRSCNDYAAQLYRRVYDLYPTAPDTEIALYRLAKLTANVYQNHQHAHMIYAEMLRLFPYGDMSLEARRILQTG